jgi:hypothetical protein
MVPATRQPDSGSARTGHPVLAARRPTAAGSQPAPATTTPRGARSCSVTASSAARLGEVAGQARCQGAPSSRPGGREPGSPTSGSRKARFRCTGPGRAPVASATARAPSERQVAAVTGSGTPGSAAHRTAVP